MKIVVVLAFLLCVLLAYAQEERPCDAQARRPNCKGGMDTGHGGRGCHDRTMWYHANGQCRKMEYKGCGGNENRYCTKAACERECEKCG